MVLFIISALIAIVSLGVGIYLVRDFIKNIIPKLTFIPLFKRLAIIVGVFTLSFATMMVSIHLWAKNKPNGYELTASILGGLLVGLFASVSLFSFLLHYYGKSESKGVSEKADKRLFISLMVAFPLLFFAILFLSDGYARFMTYPIINGLSFSHGFVSPSSVDSPNIAFYALCILSGAVYVYFLCDHKLYLEYGKHGIVDSTFLVAFPAGILGARIFYVIGNWKVEFAGQEWWKMFAIWEGGLTILGGAITGIVVGVAWYIWRNKGYNIWLAVDIIVPTILIAQAVGRWGNFFNCEVHGVLSSASYWKWLPDVVELNARYSSSSGWAPEGQIYVPLFFIECFTNLFGYFVIAHLFGKALRKYTQLGDLAFGYVMWYGLTRVFMEPLRDTAFNMGENGYWSWFWSLIFVVGGALAIAINHLVRYMKKPKVIKEMYYIITSACYLAVGMILAITGVIMMSKSSFSQSLVLNQFNWGLILLALGISSLFGLLITVPPILSRKKQKQAEMES